MHGICDMALSKGECKQISMFTVFPEVYLTFMVLTSAYVSLFIIVFSSSLEDNICVAYLPCFHVAICLHDWANQSCQIRHHQDPCSVFSPSFLQLPMDSKKQYILSVIFEIFVERAVAKINSRKNFTRPQAP